MQAGDSCRWANHAGGRIMLFKKQSLDGATSIYLFLPLSPSSLSCLLLHFQWFSLCPLGDSNLGPLDWQACTLTTRPWSLHL